MSEVFHYSGFGGSRIPGREPNGQSYGSYATFSDPDGNSWLLQEIKTRLPGRGESSLDVPTLTELLREAETHHGQYEPTAPKHHWSGWYGAHLLRRSVTEEIDAMQEHAGLLTALGATAMVFAEETGSVHGRLGVPLSTRPRLAEADWTRFCEALTEAAEHLTRRGIRLAYHHHMGTVVETEQEIDRLMRSTGPAVGLLLDTGHLTYAGGDVLGVARRHAHRIVHVHCKDVRPAVLTEARRRDQSFLDAVVDGVFTVPGDGCVDYKALLGILRDAGYAGWLVVEAEQDPAKAHPLSYARMGFAHLSRLLADLRM